MSDLPPSSSNDFITYHLQATYASFLRQVRGHITLLRAAEGNASTGTAESAPRDVSLLALVLEWMSNNTAVWRPEQVPLANLIYHQQFQVANSATALSWPTHSAFQPVICMHTHSKHCMHAMCGMHHEYGYMCSRSDTALQNERRCCCCCCCCCC
jgi:hypothetical protein